jgi:alkanesulfonate monooxygenase SsuD/methylene tetrahydromethanopterin reductase-like flavin-dependent oxidoreductase (luciferase family)
MWHPIRLAEDYAQADIMTGGRVIMGVGRGYHTREVETFGAPMLDNKAKQELFEEQMEVLLKCFNEESWSHKGKHYTIPAPVSTTTRKNHRRAASLHLPVEIWQPIASGKTLPYIAQRGIKAWTPNGERIFDLCGARLPVEAAKAGRKLALGENICWGAGPYLADTIEAKPSRASALPRRALQVFAPFGFVRYADEEAARACRRARAVPAFARRSRRRPCGPPARHPSRPRVRVM